MTHREAPWRDARGVLGPNDRSMAEITHEAMLAFFLPRLDKWVYHRDPHVNKDLWEKARKAVESGRVQTVQEVRRELHRRCAKPDPG